MNKVNGRDTVFVRYVSLCVCVSVCAQPSGQSNQFKTVKATDFKFDKRVPQGQFGHNPLKLLFCRNSLGRDMHSHERLLVFTVLKRFS